MTSIQKEQILRLNCPGFGEESFLTIGKARSLDSYSVIIVNPVSILHLFDRAPDAVKEIDTKLAEGLTSYSTRDDDLLQALESDLKKRIFELVNFLEKGGLLIYYLCRPFLVQAPGMSMDNYYWLESLAPDTPSESNVRHMSAVSHGRIVEPTEHAAQSEFSAYLKQSGLEWNTIIRTDFLTEGYIVLATAGPRKCISAHLIAGDTGGRIVFLPSPYSPDFDRSLMECVQLWHERKVEEFGAPTEAAKAVPAQQAAAAAAPAATPAAAPAPQGAEKAPPQFNQPDPAKFLSPKSEEAPAKPPQTPAQKPIAINNPLSAAAAASSSRSNLPPVTKFTTSRPLPGSDAAKMSADEILDSVAKQADETDVEEEPRTFNERATSDIGTAFSKLNSPLPQATDSGGYQVPSAQDLLKELESMSAPTHQAKPEPAKAEPPRQKQTESMPAAAGAPKEEKTFFETLSAKADEKQEAKPTPPAQPSKPSLVQSVAEAKPLGAVDYKLGVDVPKAPEKKEPMITPPPQPKPAEPPKPEPPRVEPKPAVPPPVQSKPPEPNGQGNRLDRKPEFDNNRYEVERTPEAKELIKKMEEITKAAPDWCKDYSFPDLEDLKKERGHLADSIRQTQIKISALEDKITVLEGLKNALLAAEGEQLMTSCSRVFKRLGWMAKVSDKHDSEFVLNINDKPEVIARVVRSTAQAKSGDVAELAQAVITFWGEHEIEPKGVLIACTWANRPPSERNEADYTDALNDFAQKKNLCLMTTMQLLSMYRDLEMGKVSPDEIRRRIVDTNGRLTGFQLGSSMSRAGA
jgi:hypothetical protein